MQILKRMAGYLDIGAQSLCPHSLAVGEDEGAEGVRVGPVVCPENKERIGDSLVLQEVLNVWAGVDLRTVHQKRREDRSGKVGKSLIRVTDARYEYGEVPSCPVCVELVHERQWGLAEDHDVVRCIGLERPPPGVPDAHGRE